MHTFASYCSVWILLGIKNWVKFVSFSQWKGRSYIVFPSNFPICQSLIIFRNIADENCFWFCYTAAYHLYTEKPLIERSSWRCKTSPNTSNPSFNPLAKKHLSEFSMPIAFKQIDRFEKLNQFQVNVFRFQKRISKFRYDFIKDLLLLSEEGTHHYVLVTDLRHSVNFLENKQSRSRDKFWRNVF